VIEVNRLEASFMKKPQSLIPIKLNFEGWNKKINYIKGSEIKKIVIKIMRVKIEIKYKLKSNQNFLIKKKTRTKLEKNNTPKTWIEEWNWKLIKLLQKNKGKNKN